MELRRPIREAEGPNLDRPTAPPLPSTLHGFQTTPSVRANFFGGTTLATIRLEGLSVFGHHGARPYEKEAGQRLEVDLILEPTNTSAELSDKISETVDYDLLYQLVREVVEGESFHLLEKLARVIADTILERFAIQQATVRIAKQNLGWTTGGRAIIEVTRTRA